MVVVVGSTWLSPQDFDWGELQRMRAPEES
jgi:hypothetical protein